MHGDIVKAAWVLGGCFLLAGLVLSGVVWFSAHTAMGRVEEQLQRLTHEMATPIQNLFDRPVKVTTEGVVEIREPLLIRGPLEQGVLPVSTEIPGGGN